VSEPVLTLEQVSVPGRLAPLSFSIPAGGLHAVVGANGSGKSTLLDAILGLVTHRGRVELRPGTSMAIVPQRVEHASHSPLTVLEFFATSWTIRPSWLGVSPSTRTRCEQALATTKLAHALDRPLASLSGGELRRVVIAHALAQAPGLLLLDEPEAGLDASSKVLLQASLQEATAKGVAVLWVSHDDDAVRALSTQRSTLEAP
jgi:zinc transport system ATP-binding protein